MTNEISSLAFIPARAGSKRLPGKMLKDFAGKPLVVWAAEAAIASKCFDRIVVSSESSEILQQVAELENVEALCRPIELADDAATTMDVLQSFIENPDKHIERHPRANLGRLGPNSLITLLQPTSPLREASDIRNTLALMNQRVDTALSVMEAPVPPQRSFPIDVVSGLCKIPEDSALLVGRTQKQSYEPMFTPNGSVYVSRRAHIEGRRSFFAGAVAYYLMPRDRSIDIDDDLDWLIAERLVARGRCGR